MGGSTSHLCVCVCVCVCVCACVHACVRVCMSVCVDKSSQHSPFLVLLFVDNIPKCIVCVYASSKDVSHYDFCVKSISVMLFKKG